MTNNNEINEALKNMWEVAKKATEKIASSNKKANDLQSQFDFLENTINQKNKKVEELTNKVKEFEKNINEKNERITSQYAEIDVLVRRQEKYSELETSYFTVVNENQNLKNEIENSITNNQKFEKLHSEHQAVSEKFHNIKNENINLKNKLDSQEKEIQYYEIAKKELTNNRLEIINQNEQIDKLKTQLAESQSTVLNQYEKNKFLEQNNSALNEKNVLQTQEIKAFDEELNKIISQNNIEKMDLIAKNSSVQNELKDILHSKQYLENLLQAKENQILKTQKENEEKINNLLAEKDKIVTECQNIIKQYSEDVAEMQGIVEELNYDFNAKNEVYHSSENAKIIYEKKIVEYEKSVAELKQILKITEEMNAGLEKKLRENSQIDNAVAEENKKIKAKNEELMNANRLLLEKNEALSQKIILSDENDFANTSKNSTELANENERLLDIVVELNDKLDKMQHEYKNAIGENTKLAKDNKGLQSESQKIQKLTAAFENIKKTNDEQTETITELKNELTYYKKRVYDDDSLFAAENINLLGDVEIKYKQQIDILNLEINRMSNENKEILEKNAALLKEKEVAREKETARSVEIERKQEAEKNISPPKNEMNKNELVNKLENFLSKLEEKIVS